MGTAKNGAKVLFNYVGKLEDGTIFDSTFESDCADDDCSSDDCSTDDCGCGHATGPMELVIGSGEFFPAVESALAAMAAGEKRNVVIPAAEAFGEFDDGKLFTVPVTDLPEDFDAQVGDELILSGEDDEELGVTVVEITADEITFDANHPLAGQNLTFELELLSIL
ncbi:MAG: FKBP-type peptidylprolyl cis-trans isomerase [Deltaproteobacteria bacterium]|nr:FKBP-type peptidylprolyl cis-trans isomerase [Deltaproteobacteria bacterium]